MRRHPKLLSILALYAAGVCVISACIEDSASLAPGVLGDADGGARRAPGAPAAPACAPPEAQDPRDLPPCCVDVGGAHCLRQADLPPGLTSVFAACAGGLCLPDDVIRTGGQFTPASCSSTGGAPGVCTSLCVPRVRQGMDRYPQDTCAASERCAPCSEDGAPTGLCPLDLSCPAPPPPPPPAPPPSGGDDSRGTPADPPLDDDDVKDGGPRSPSTPPAPRPPPPPAPPPGGGDRCCGGAGSCVPSSGAPAGVAGRLSAEGCASGELCLPDSFAGGARPSSCSAMIPFIGGVGGACIPACMVDLGGLGVVVQQGSCSTGELCVPCELPFGGSTGLCG